MNIKNNNMIAFINGVATIQSKKLPIKVGYAISKNIKIMEPIAVAYDEERKKILDKYASKDESGELLVDGDSYVIENQEGYKKEIQELLDIDNEIQIHTISFSELEKCDTEKFDALSVQDISLLEFMME